MSGRNGGANSYYGQHLAGTAAGEILFRKNPAAAREGLIERMLIRVLTEMCVNRFKWEGLPDSVDVRYMELTLFRYALSIFYHDKVFDKWLALQGAPSGRMNFAQNPTAFTINGNSNFISKRLPAKHVVPIWANMLRVPDMDIVFIYAQRLAELDRTIEINSKNARQTKVLAVDENQRLTGVNFVRQIDSGENLIQVNDGNGMGGDVKDRVTVLDLGVDPNQIEKLHILRTRMWSECMGLLGLDNSNQDKKERLVAAEVDANDDQTQNMRQVNLNSRQAAAKQMSELYGKEITVSYYVDEQDEATPLTEGETDEDGRTSYTKDDE